MSVSNISLRRSYGYRDGVQKATARAGGGGGSCCHKNLDSVRPLVSLISLICFRSGRQNWDEESFIKESL
jgi:hypothetical protein